MGVRTEHQQDAKAQLVVRTAWAPARTGQSGGAAADTAGAGEGDGASGDEAEALDAAAAGGPAGELVGLSGASDVLPTPRLLDAGDGAHVLPKNKRTTGQCERLLCPQGTVERCGSLRPPHCLTCGSLLHGVWEAVPVLAVQGIDDITDVSIINTRVG